MDEPLRSAMVAAVSGVGSAGDGRGMQRRTTAIVALAHTVQPDGAPRLAFVHDKDSSRVAAFRVLRHKLREVGSPRIMAVTSPNPGEGKTACAIDLAMAFAEDGHAKVLLVEANFRRPGMAAALGFSAPACFCAQMVAHVETPSAPWLVASAFFRNLHVLSVDPDGGGAQVLHMPAFRLAMDQLRAADYQCIILDCCHVLGSAEVHVVEGHVDGVLFTAMARKTSAASLRQAVDYLSPANTLGVVLVNG